MASTRLEITPGSNYADTWTWSGWVKRTGTGGSGLFNNQRTDNNVNSRFKLFFNSSDELQWEIKDSTGSDDSSFRTNRVFRDTSAWYHIVFTYDTTNATAGDRIRLYVNGERETSFAAEDQASNNFGSLWSSSVKHYVGVANDNNGLANYLNGSMAHVHLTWGTTYEPSTFGETDSTTGIWKPITAPSVTYGDEGYFLKFASAGSLGTDSSGNGNNFTLSGSGTQTQDSPANVFSTWNPLSYNSANGNWALGATEFNTGAAAYRSTFSSLAANKGKYYMEVKLSGGTNYSIGVLSIDMKSETDNIGYIGDGNCGTRAVGYLKDGNTSVNGSETSGFSSFASGDIIMVALDLDNGKVYFGKNGTWGNSGDPTSGATGTGARSITVSTNEYWGFGASVFANTVYGNFGNGYFGTTAVSSANSDGNGFGLFEYEVPSGYYALCTKNINSQEYS